MSSATTQWPVIPIAPTHERRAWMRHHSSLRSFLCPHHAGSAHWFLVAGSRLPFATAATG
uniref:Uncharacterized protein n=1 Tax=Oryza rufipogon TaxID=4529 RepID=A0A0E0P7K7_ORYRU